jgi:uncharacterized membrane protein
VTPERFRVIVSGILIVGVSVSATLILVGFLTSFLVGWEGSLVGAPAETTPLTDFASMPASLAAVRPVGIAQLGLLVLIATPVVRVAASVIAFLLEGDRLYAGITFAVLVILLLSLFGLH